MSSKKYVNKGGVYTVENTTAGKIYVGITSNIYRDYLRFKKLKSNGLVKTKAYYEEKLYGEQEYQELAAIQQDYNCGDVFEFNVIEVKDINKNNKNTVSKELNTIQNKLVRKHKKIAGVYNVPLPPFDALCFNYYNRDGTIIYGNTIGEGKRNKITVKRFCEKYNVSLKMVKLGLEGGNAVSYQHKDWLITIKKYENIDTLFRPVYSFISKEGKIVKNVTQSYMMRYEGMTYPKLSMLCNNVKQSANGWKLYTEEDTADKLDMKVIEELDLIIGGWYRRKPLKDRLNDIYKCLGISGNATANDVCKYYKVKLAKKTIDGKRVVGYKIIEPLILI